MHNQSHLVHSPEDHQQQQQRSGYNNFISPGRSEFARQSIYQQPGQASLYGSQGYGRDTLSSQNSQPLRFSGSQSHLRGPSAGNQGADRQPTALQPQRLDTRERDLQNSSLMVSRSINLGGPSRGPQEPRDLNQSMAGLNLNQT